MRIDYITLKADIIKNHKKKLEVWFKECDKNNVDDLDRFDLRNIASDFGINLSKYLRG